MCVSLWNEQKVLSVIFGGGGGGGGGGIYTEVVRMPGMGLCTGSYLRGGDLLAIGFYGISFYLIK